MLIFLLHYRGSTAVHFCPTNYRRVSWNLVHLSPHIWWLRVNLCSVICQLICYFVRLLHLF